MRLMCVHRNAYVHAHTIHRYLCVSRGGVGGVLMAKGRRRQSAGRYLISSSSKTPTLPPHFLLPRSPPALTESKQTIRGDYYEEEKRKGLASRFPNSLDGSLFCEIQVTDKSSMTTDPLCV